MFEFPDTENRNNVKWKQFLYELCSLYEGILVSYEETKGLRLMFYANIAHYITEQKVVKQRQKSNKIFLNHRNHLPHGNIRPCMSLKPFSRLKTTFRVSVSHLTHDFAFALTWIQKRKWQVNKSSAQSCCIFMHISGRLPSWLCATICLLTVL